MIRKTLLATLLALALTPIAPAGAQVPPIAPLTGTRLDVTATGEVSRIPDIVRIEAGVVTQAPTAGEAMRQNGARMARVRAALAQAGVAERDVQTSSFSLAAYYRQTADRESVLAGYRTSNQLIVRLRDVTNSGRVLDALVAEGVNDIDGPILNHENREAALDEARTRAIAAARARADLYARGLGMRVKRAVLVTEAPRYRDADNVANMASNTIVGSTIDTGGRVLSATVSVVFELE